MGHVSSRILLADNNPALLEAIVEILEREFSVVGMVRNGTALLSCLLELNPDLLVLDVSLGDMTGFDVVRELKATGWRTRIVILTVYETPDFVSVAFELGVDGYVFKSRINPDLLDAVRIVSLGGHFIPLPSPMFE